MSEQVVIGTLLDPNTIHVSGARPDALPDQWDHRAMWSWARLQFGKGIADKRIKDHFEMIETMKDARLSIVERRKEMQLLFADLVAEQKKPRELQYIFSGNRIMAVASLKHLLIPPSEVYDMADKILAVNYPRIKGMSLEGYHYKVGEVNGNPMGLQVYGGSITTRQAITVTTWLRVELCLNALSWLGISAFGGFGISGDYERVLRIKVRAELEPRLRDAIDHTVSRIGSIEQRIHVTDKVKVKRSEARIIMAALGISYYLGVRSIKQVLDRFKKEPKTLWGLSMAASWVASHGKLRKTPKEQHRLVEQRLSTIAGATLLIDDIKKAKKSSLEWLKLHVKRGKVQTVEELLRSLS